MSKKNSNLHYAKKVKNDEFYTRLEDIEKEIWYYSSSLEGKTIYCNCDDPLDSAFTGYFIRLFKKLKLKKLICTFYDITNTKNAFAFVYEGQDMDGDGLVTEKDIEIIKSTKAFHYPLIDDVGFDYQHKDECWKKGIYGKGDFRSKNCIEYLLISDIVITNPPFSLFREYITQLINYNKDFLIIGNKNAITYKEIFPYIKENKLWLGITNPDEYRLPNGEITKKVKGLNRWFTNIKHKKRNEKLTLYKKYSSEKYPKYDNYNAINIEKTHEIPLDYDGVMGVPITFLDKYCPTQFEILDARNYTSVDKLKNKSTLLIKDKDGTINGKTTYARILIKRR